MNKYLTNISQTSMNVLKNSKLVFKNFVDVLKNHYTDFKGKANISQFWMFILCLFICYLIMGLAYIPSKTVGIIFRVLLTIATITPCIAITVRRVRDAGFDHRLGFLSAIIYIFVLLCMLPDGILNNGFVKVLMAFLNLANFVSVIALIVFCVLPSKQD